jgi:acyl-CoA synthetase (AMP-forming)/AMP-acid ligase II
MSLKTLSELLHQSTRQFADETALIAQGTRYTYRDLNEQTDRLACGLREMGLAPEEKVAVCAWNSPELVLSFFAIWKMGGVVVDINPSLKPEDVIRILHQCKTRVLITESTQKTLLEQIIDDSGFLSTILFLDEAPAQIPDFRFRILDFRNLRSTICNLQSVPLSPLACINYTSGSTGVPKGVLLPHKNLIRNAELNVKYFQISARDKTSLVLPLFFGMNKIFLLAHLLVGAGVLLERNFLSPNAVLASMEAEQVTGLSAVPAVYHTLLTRGDVSRYSLKSLRYFRIGAGQVTSEMIQSLHRTFSQVSIYLTYGLTEVGLVTVLPPEKLLEKWGSCGRVIPEVQTKLVPTLSHSHTPTLPIGELIVQCDHAAVGYYENEEETRNVFREEGVHTGDLGWIDKEGYLYLVGRQKELIKSGSENIHPQEVETVLNSHEGITESAVIGVPDKWLGEAIKAFVVPQKGYFLDIDHILKFCKDRLSPIKRPRYIVLCDALPKTETGKIKKGELKAETTGTFYETVDKRK